MSFIKNIVKLKYYISNLIYSNSDEYYDNRGKLQLNNYSDVETLIMYSKQNSNLNIEYIKNERIIEIIEYINYKTHTYAKIYFDSDLLVENNIINMIDIYNMQYLDYIYYNFNINERIYIKINTDYNKNINKMLYDLKYYNISKLYLNFESIFSRIKKFIYYNINVNVKNLTLANSIPITVEIPLYMYIFIIQFEKYKIVKHIIR